MLIWNVYPIQRRYHIQVCLSILRRYYIQEVGISINAKKKPYTSMSIHTKKILYTGGWNFLMLRRNHMQVHNFSLLVGNLISSESLNVGGCWGTTDDVATIPFHPSLPSAAVSETLNPIPVHSLMLPSCLFCLPLLAPFTVPCRIVLAMPEDLEMWPYHLSFIFFTMVRRSSSTPVAFWILLRTSLFGTVFVGNIQKSPIASHLKGLDPSLDFCCQGPALTGLKEGK